ncbi:nucleotidyltransferase [Sulfitobacter porphyrae]|uniref:Cyclic GMP-AMP synthase n=1 Tax=Sulfitobacter porphyrae TaxID=1246864 RepID=A0ABW2BC63_9RHOB
MMNTSSNIGFGYNVAIEKLAEELAVPQDRFDQAERRYKDLGEFLHRDESKVRDYDPDVYIQGSFALGTPIKPTSKNEDYDLDIVVSFRSLTKAQITQADLRAHLLAELEAYRDARGIKNEVGESRRCCTLIYAEGAQFHMDVLLKRFQTRQICARSFLLTSRIKRLRKVRSPSPTAIRLKLTMSLRMIGARAIPGALPHGSSQGRSNN